LVEVEGNPDCGIALAPNCVLLGTVIIKRLQTLVWWVRDHQKQGLALEAVNFDVAAMNEAAEMKNSRRELNDKEPFISN
jgi:hypothetical protein